MDGDQTDQTSTAPAEAVIQEKMSDDGFMRSLYNRHDENHAASLQEWKDLHGRAASERDAASKDVPASDSAADVDDDAEDVEDSDDEVQAEPFDIGDHAGEAEFREAQDALRNEYGEQWEAKATLAHETLKRLGGDELVDEVVQLGLGNDSLLIGHMIQLAEEDKTFPAVGLARELVAKVKTNDGARLELARREADSEFMDAYFQGHHPRHRAAAVEMKILHALAAGSRTEEVIG